MQNDNLVNNSLRFIFKDLIGSILFWPVWWYTQGFFTVSQIILKNLKKEEESFGLKIWMASLFKPMYGQYDWQGRLISFFMRIIILIFKLAAFVVWLIIYAIIIAAWLLLPIAAIFQIAKNFYNFFEL